MNDNIWLVVAAYNEGSVIRAVLEEALQTFSNIVVIDDGSSDDTAEQIKSTSTWYIKHPINLGQGAALQTGISFALSQGAMYISTYDADGQHRVEDVLKMYELIVSQNLDVVLGSRFLGNAIGISKFKRFFLKCATFFTNIVSGVKLTDAHNGLRMLSNKAAKVIKIKQNRMSHASEIIDLIGKHKLTYAECPVTIVYTEYSIAKGQRLSNSISILLDHFFSKLHG
ncbi:glycosyltransferase family 2 protein [Undibacterium sp. Ren11W]|uniref:glycosyltransferase family 2 protein n=1 Tax=Undibacterium sp. Ren11W TaxID=3413045 RepID=UPI003BF32484